MSAMILDLRPSGRIADGGTVFKIAGSDSWLWLASPAGIFHFDGAAWRAVMRGVPFWWVNTVLTAGNSVWAAGLPGGLVRSVDGDQAWSRCWAEQVEAPVISLAASPNFGRDRVVLAGTDGDGILRSIDGGRHWNLSNFGLRSYAVFDLVAAPDWERYEYAFAVTEEGLYQSPNGGRAWRRADLDDAGRQPSVAAVSPGFAADRTVFAGCEGGELLVSTDAGRSYHLAAAGFEAITALAFTPQGSLLVGTTGGVSRIEGKELRSYTDLRENGASRGVGGRVGKDGIQALEAAMPDFAGSPSAEGIFVSSEQISSVLSLNAVGGSLYAGLNDGLYRSVDDGRSWRFVSGLSARRFVWCLTPAPDLWLVGGPEEGVWRCDGLTEADGSSKAGSWRPIWTDTPVLALTANGSQIWLSSETGVETSVDGGASWQPGLTAATPITALAATERAVWAGSHDSRLWHGALDGSAGRGGNWKAVQPPFAGSQMLGLYARGEVLLAAVWAVSDRPAAGGSAAAESGTMTLWRSEDDGQSWSNWFSRPSRPVAPQLAFVDGAGCAALIGLGVDLYRSTASGWQRQRLTTADAPISGLLPLANQTLVSLTDRLVVSAGGSEWEPVESGVDGQSLAALGQSGEQVVVVTSDGQIWQGRHETD